MLAIIIIRLQQPLLPPLLLRSLKRVRFPSIIFWRPVHVSPLLCRPTTGHPWVTAIKLQLISIVSRCEREERYQSAKFTVEMAND